MEIIQIETVNGLVDYVLIDRGNDEFITVTKAEWDELEAQREQSGTL